MSADQSNFEVQNELTKTISACVNRHRNKANAYAAVLGEIEGILADLLTIEQKKSMIRRLLDMRDEEAEW